MGYGLHEFNSIISVDEIFVENMKYRHEYFLKQDTEYDKKLMEKLHGPSPLDPYLVCMTILHQQYV